MAAADELRASLDEEGEPAAGLYRGLAGLAFAFWEVCRASGEARFYESARQCLDRLVATGRSRGAGLGWIEPIPFSELHGHRGETEIFDLSRGSAGVGVGLLWAAERGLRPELIETATGIGDRLLQVAEPVAGGLQWPMMADQPFAWTAPNFSHGTAGVAYFLARLHEATAEERFLDAALAGASRLERIATVDGDSRLVYHNEERGPELFYLSWCHGPPGTGRLFYVLERITGEERWRDMLVGGGRGILRSGVPEERTRGFWNNVGQCCGDAGVGELALTLHRTTGEEAFLDLAWRLADHLEERALRDRQGARWIHAEHRTRPELLQAQTGYMQGAAGVGSFLLHLASVSGGVRAKIPFPDWPFGDLAD